MKKLSIAIAVAAVGVAGTAMAQPSQAGSAIQWTCPAGYSLGSMRDGSPVCLPASGTSTSTVNGAAGAQGSPVPSGPRTKSNVMTGHTSGTEVGADIESYGKAAGASGSRVSTPRSQITDRHQGYGGPGSSATGIGQDLGSYGKTSGAEGAGNPDPVGTDPRVGGPRVRRGEAGRHQGYSGPGSSATGIGQQHEGYGQTPGNPGAGR